MGPVQHVCLELSMRSPRALAQQSAPLLLGGVPHLRDCADKCARAECCKLKQIKSASSAPARSQQGRDPARHAPRGAAHTQYPPVCALLPPLPPPPAHAPASSTASKSHSMVNSPSLWRPARHAASAASEPGGAAGGREHSVCVGTGGSVCRHAQRSKWEQSKCRVHGSCRAQFVGVGNPYMRCLGPRLCSSRC